MESKQDKIETLQIAIKHLIDDEKRSYKDVSITDRDKEIDHRLLSRLLSQLKALRDDLLQEDSVTRTCDDNERRTKDLREPEVVQPKKKKASVKKESSFVNEQDNTVILKHLFRAIDIKFPKYAQLDLPSFDIIRINNNLHV